MNRDCLKLAAYFGEQDRAGGRLVADELLGCFEQAALAGSLLLRGTEGFGCSHHLHTHRIETLSVDLPMVAVAVDTRERIKQVLPAVTAQMHGGIVTVARTRLLTVDVGHVRLVEALDETTKLTIYCARQQRAGQVPAHLAITDLLYRCGVAGAIVLPGVDGTVRGTRQRTQLFGRRADPPLMVIAVSTGESIAAVLPELGRLLPDPLVTLEQVQVRNRDGPPLATADLPTGISSARGELWQELTVHSGQERGLHVELVRRLRAAGAAGATCLRGIWGYHGQHPPHRDRPWTFRRHVPVVTVVVDSPERSRRWSQIADEVTSGMGLVTSQAVLAFPATATDRQEGRIDLA